MVCTISELRCIKDLSSSSTDVVADWHPFSCSLNEVPTGSDPTADETGEVQLFKRSEADEAHVSDPTADRTEVGERSSCSFPDIFDSNWVSCSGTESSGVKHHSCLSIAGMLGELPSLRGYGCRGFLLGRGGGISILFASPKLSPADTRTTCTIDIIMKC